MARAGGLTRMYPTPLRAQWVAHEDLADDITVTILVLDPKRLPAERLSSNPMAV